MPAYVTVNGIRYELSDHCLKQMARRRIKKQNIQSCLNYSQVSCIFKCGYSLYIEDYSNGRRLQVIVNPENNQIVSVVWLTL